MFRETREVGFDDGGEFSTERWLWSVCDDGRAYGIIIRKPSLKKEGMKSIERSKKNSIL